MKAVLSMQADETADMIVGMDKTAERIKHLRQQHGLTQAAFAERVTSRLRAMGEPNETISRGAVGNWEYGGGVSNRNLRAIAAEFAVDIDWLLAFEDQGHVTPAPVTLPARDEMPRNIPVLGTAAGAALNNGAFQLTTDPVDYVARPPGLASARGIYALYVEGDSMLPKYEQGELIFVNPNRPPHIGDAVVIQEPNETEYRAYLKILSKRTPEWIVTRQLNPEGDVKFKRSEALRIHKVLTTAELFGL